MPIIAPNFVSVRLDEQDKQNFAKVAEHAQRIIGIPLSTADVYRLAIKALAEKNGTTGVR